LEFLCVQKTHTVENADIVLPASSYAETEGSFTSMDGRVQKLSKAVEPPVCFTNFEQVRRLIAQTGGKARYRRVADAMACVAGSPVCGKLALSK
jgi:predicted molibdopterin-dependent oxidoreductase YjgC